MYCYANLFCHANFSLVFGPDFREANVSGGGGQTGGKQPQRGAPALCGRKPISFCKNRET